jgi:uncharacterized protein YraI
MKVLRSVIVAAFATIALSAAPSIAQAAQGFIVDQTDLRAGPDDQFPSVDLLPAGAQVEVFGCLSGHTWCDVGFQQDRGWVSGQDLEVLFQNNRVKIVTIETEVVPVETFQVAVYWDAHYRDKPFFRDRDRFASLNININNGGKTAPGSTGSGGQAAVTGGGKEKVETGKTATGGAAPSSAGSANANAGCPPDQKNCKEKGGVGGGKAMTGEKSPSGAMTGEKKAMTGEKKAMTGEKTGSMAPGKAGETGKVDESIGKKGCKPGTPNCPKGAGNGG